MTSSRFILGDVGIVAKSDGYYKLHWNDRYMNTLGHVDPLVKYLFAIVLNLDLNGDTNDSGSHLYPVR
jgi:hypothetical protein